MDTGTPRTAAKPCTDPGHTELVSAWCQTCQTFVCIQDIVSVKHAGHLFVSLEKIAGEHRAKIEQKKEELRKIMENLDAVLKHQLETESKFIAKTEDINNAIDERSKTLLSEIESWKTKAKSLLRKKVEENKEYMTARQDQIKEDQNKLRTALEHCSPDNYEASLVMADDAIQAKRQSSVYSPAELLLTEGNSAKLDMEALLGHISDEDSYGSDCLSNVEPIAVTASKDDVQLHLSAQTAVSTDETSTDKIKDIPTEVIPAGVEILEHCQFPWRNQHSHVIKLAASRTGGVWLACTGQRWIKHFDDQGNSRQQVTADFDVSDIGVNSKNELFASVKNGCRIQKKAYFNWGKFVKTEPLVTFGINFTSEDDLLVCLQGIYHAEVARYSPTGEVQQRIRLDQDNKEIFHKPRQVIQVGQTGDVMVIDDKTVISLDKGGKVTKTWRGEGGGETGNEAVKSLCQPVGLAVTPEGDLFVLDHGNKQIVVFDKLGQILWNMNNTVMLKDMSSAVFDTKEQIWVACSDGAIHKAELRIHRKTKKD